MTKMPPDYVGRNARLSQAWMSSPTLILIMVIAKIVLFRSLINTFISTALTALDTECHALKSAYELIADAPVNSILLANHLVSSLISHSINEAKKGLMSSITSIEELVTLAFDMTLGTYSCLAISAVNIAGNEALNATESTVKLANTVSESLGKEINKGLGGLSDFINGAVGLLSETESFFHQGDDKIKNLSLVVNKLNNLSLPVDSINTKLNSLRSDIPTYESTRSFITDELSQPFTAIKHSLKKISTNVTVIVPFPSSWNNTHTSLPQCNNQKLQQNISLCNSKINQLLTAIIVLCGVSLVIGVVYNFWHTHRTWAKMVELARSDHISQSSSSHNTIEEINLSKFAYLQSNCFERFLIDRKCITRNSLRWLRFVSMRPVVEFLVIGLIGMIISFFELAIVSSIHFILHELEKMEENSSIDLRAQIDSSFDLWREQVNANILNIENKFNNQLLGGLHKNSQSLNDTLSSFSKAMNNDIARGFNNTALYTPLKSALACLLGNKINDMEKALTWVNKNSQVTLPRIDLNLTLSSEVFNKIESSATSTTAEALRYLRHTIRVQIIISGVFLVVWVLYLLFSGLIFFNLIPCGTLFSKFIRNIFQNFQRDSQNENHNLEKQQQILSPVHTFHHAESVPPQLTVTANNLDSCEDSYASEYDSQGNDRTYHIPAELTRINLTPLSPTRRLQNCITRFFNGPEKGVTVLSLNSPARGSIHLPDDPSTPLRAMIF